MVERNYTVKYDIVADATKAIGVFKGLTPTITELNAQMTSLANNMSSVVADLNSFRSKFQSPIKIQFTIDTTGVKNGLASIEMNAKHTAAKVRAAMESAFKGTTANHQKMLANLGTGNWQSYRAPDRKQYDALRNQRAMIRMALDSLLPSKKVSAKNAYDAKKYIEKHYGGNLKDFYTSVNNLLKEYGLGQLINQKPSGWKFSGNARSKVEDLYKDLGKKIEVEKNKINGILKAEKNANAAVRENVRPVTGGKGIGMMGVLGLDHTEIDKIGKSIKSLTASIAEIPGNEILIPVKLTGLSQAKTELSTFLNSLQGVANTGVSETSPVKSSPKSSPKAKSATPRGKKTNKIVTTPAVKLSEDISKLANKYLNVKGANLFDQYIDRNVTDPFTFAPTELDKKSPKRLKGKRLKEYKKVAGFQSFLEELNKSFGGKILKKVNEAERKRKATAAGVPYNRVYGINDMRVYTPMSVRELLNQTKKALGLPYEETEIIPAEKTKPKAASSGVKKPKAKTASTPAQIAKSSTTLPVSIHLDRTKIGGQLNSSLRNLRTIAAENIIKIPAHIDRTKVGSQLNNLLRNLRTIAAENKISVPVNLQRVDLKNPKNLPTINVKAKVTGLTSAVREANIAFQNRAKAMKNAPAIRIPIQLKWGTGQENMQAQIKKMQSSIPALKVGINLELAKAQIDELAAYIQKKGIINLGGMSGAKSQGQFRNYRPGSNEGVSYAGGGGGGRGRFGGSSGGMVYGGGGEGNFLTRLRRFAYPLTGNLSYGASSPMALQMFKDMPIMMGVGGAIGAITGGISNSFEYQDTMRVARSILERGYKGDNFERDYRNMEVTARNVARATKFTAPEAAEAVRFMAMAGLDIPRINSSIKPISDIALIGRNNLGDIADIMTNVQTTYKISPDKMERMADAMANTFTKTNVDMMMIAESLKYAGGIAQLTGTSLGDSLAMIGIMGNNGIQGSMAGTSTRMMMQNMIRPNKNQAAMWAKIGINTRDENGFVKDPIRLLGELRGYVDKKYGSDAYMKLGKGEEFKNKALGDLVSNMFRVTSTAGVAALLRDYDKLVQLSASNRSSDINGLAGQLSEKQQNEVKGLIAKISSSFQEQILQIIEKNTGWIKQKLVDINKWVSSPETQKKLEILIDTLKNIVQGFIHVGEGALWAYEKFNKIKIFGEGLVDTLIKFQLYMSALGSALRLVLSPLNIFSGFNFGGMSAAGAASSIGRIIASSKPRAFVNAIGQRVYNTENDGLAPITTVYNSGSYKRPYSRGWYSPLGQMPVVLGPIGARNLRDEQQALATISPIQQRMALYQRSRSYMTRGMTKKQKALQYASIDRQVAAMRSQIASARTAAFNETLAFGIMSNAFPLLYRRTSPVIHGRTTVPFAYNREMRPMPFYQYAKNASAIKYGGAPIAEYASEYRKRAGMYATMALSGKDYRNHAEHMRLAEMYRKAAQQAEWMQIQERKAALERMKKAAMASRRPRQLLDSELISAFIMSRGFKRSKGLIGESLRANFRAGKAFGAFKGVAGFEGLTSAITSGVMGLAKALGLLISPIGLATMAVGGLATAAYILYRRNKENKNALQRDIDGMKKIRDLTNNNNGFNASALPDSSPLKIGIARVSANSGVISQGAVKNNPLLKNNPFFRRVLAPENNLNASVYQKYAGTLYDEFIANGFNRYSESPLAASAFQDASGTFKQGPEAYRFLQSKALQGAAMLQGGSSNRVNAWTNYIKKQSEKIFAIKDTDKRNKAWEDLENKINEVSERYKKQAENLKSVTDLQKKYGDNLKNARSSEIMNTSEYRFAEARAVGNLMKDMGNGAIGQYLATHVLDSGVKDKTGAAIRAIVNGMQIGITGNNGKELVSSLSFTKNGGIDWGKLQETLKKNGVDFELTVGNKMSIISSLLEQIKGNPYYKDVTNYLEKIYQEQRREQEIKDIVAESYNRIIGLTPWGKGNDGGNGSGGDGNPDVPSPIKPAPKKSIFSSPWHLSSYSTAEGMGNNRYMANASYGGGFSNKNNVVVNVGGISVYNDADMNEIEQRIEKGVVTAMSAVLVDQSNNSMYNI